MGFLTGPPNDRAAHCAHPLRLTVMHGVQSVGMSAFPLNLPQFLNGGLCHQQDLKDLRNPALGLELSEW